MFVDQSFLSSYRHRSISSPIRTRAVECNQWYTLDPSAEHRQPEETLRYLLVTHIPFARQGISAVMDRLWAEDLRGLVASVGPVTIAAPELATVEDLQGWGPARD